MKFKQRASAAGLIMAQPRSKKDKEAGKLSKTAESYAQDWLKERIYGVKKDFSSKYTDKGNKMEEAAIEMAISWLGLPVLTQKNDEYFENEYFTGTPDLVLEDEIIDVKNSWDCFSFPLFEDELPEKLYFYQMMVYLHLTGRKEGRIIYFLMNTPEEINPWEDKHDYSKVDKKYRMKTFVVEYDQKVIDFLELQVIKVRNYINQLNK